MGSCMSKIKIDYELAFIFQIFHHLDFYVYYLSCAYIIFLILVMNIEEYKVSQQKIEEFNRKGYVKLANIANRQQLEHFRLIMNSSVQRVVSKKDNQNRIDDYSSIFTQVTNLWLVQPSSRDFVLKKKFADIARQLLKVQNVRLYHDQALVKQPKAGKTPWHQDYFYWPIDSPKTVTLWIPMHPCPRQMGTMKFVLGSHENNNLKPMPISQQSELYFESQIQKLGLEVETFDLDLGEATFHFGRTLHCAHSNGQANKREVMTIAYFQDGASALPQQQMNEFRRVDLSVFCPGVKCGQIIQSQLNPLLI